MGALDTGITHEANCLSNILCGIAEGSCDRSAVFECLAHHADISVCVAGRCSEDVCEMSRVFCRQTECRQGVRDDVRCRGEVFTGCCGKVHDALNAGEHVSGLPAGHRHVRHGVRCFGCAELGLFAHLAGLVPQGLQVVSGCTGDCSHIGHGAIKVCSCLYGSYAEAGNCCRGYGDLLSCICNAISGLFKLIPGCRDLFQRHAGGRCLFLQALELLLGFDNFALEGIIFVLSELTAFQLLFCLLLCFLQGLQLFTGGGDGVLQELLFLGQQLSVRRVELQKALHVLQC